LRPLTITTEYRLNGSGRRSTMEWTTNTKPGLPLAFWNSRTYAGGSISGHMLRRGYRFSAFPCQPFDFRRNFRRTRSNEYV